MIYSILHFFMKFYLLVICLFVYSFNTFMGEKQTVSPILKQFLSPCYIALEASDVAKSFRRGFMSGDFYGEGAMMF